MRKLSLLLSTLLLFAGFAISSGSARAQESSTMAGVAHKGESAEAAGEQEELPNPFWQWANFLLLMGGLGYLAAKNAGPFFAGRTRAIRKGIDEAEQAQADAARRVAEVDAKLSNLENELAALRREAKTEQDAEAERLQRTVADEIAKIQQHSQQEIASSTKAARNDLKRYSAQLAIELAEQKARAQMTAATQDALVQKFVGNLSQPGSRQAV